MLKLNQKRRRYWCWKCYIVWWFWHCFNGLSERAKRPLVEHVNLNSSCKFCAGATRPNIAWTIFLLLRGLGRVADKSNHFIVYSPIILSHIRSWLKLLFLHVKMYVHCPSDVPFTGQPIAKYWCHTRYFLIATVAWIFRQKLSRLEKHRLFYSFGCCLTQVFCIN